MRVLVTGTSRGIGYELVKQFLTEKGHQVIAVSRNISPLIKLKQQGKFNDLVPVQADISTAAGRKKLIAAVNASKIKIDILVNNAGELLKGPFSAVKEKDLVSIYNTNVFAPFLLSQALLPHFNKKGAHIVNIGSMGGYQGSSKYPGLSAYSSSKAALAGLSECMAVELGPKKISVNCLAIGAVQTEMLSKAFPGYKAPLSAKEMASYIKWFALNGHQFQNGKVIAVTSSNP